MCRAGLLRRGQRARRWVGVRVHSCDLGPRTMSSPFGGAVKGLETDSDLRCASAGCPVACRRSRSLRGPRAKPCAWRCSRLTACRPVARVGVAPSRAVPRTPSPEAGRGGGASPTTGVTDPVCPGDYPSLLVFASRASRARVPTAPSSPDRDPRAGARRPRRGRTARPVLHRTRGEARAKGRQGCPVNRFTSFD